MPHAPSSPVSPQNSPRRGILDWIEWLGNKLPEPVILFVFFAGVVIIASDVASRSGWRVQPLQPTLEVAPMVDDAGRPMLDDKGLAKTTTVRDPDTGKPRVTLKPVGEPIQSRSLLSRDGVYWMLSSMVRNFVLFPALGLVLTSMLGIGLAEKVGLFGTFMRWLASITPRKLLTPVIVFLGANASVASDAGYIILPPLAAGLFAATGRSPIAGLAAAFAGVAGGFGGGFFLTAADTFVAGAATSAAQIIDPAYSVVATANWSFKAGSAILIMLAGWWVTDRIVEPRLLRAARADAGAATPDEPGSFALSAVERKGMAFAGLSMALLGGLFAAAIAIPGWPLHGVGQPTPTDREGPRWSHVIVPMMFFMFLTPGLVFGIVTGSIRSQRDFVDGLYHAIRSVVPVIAIAFFAAQFVAYFQHSRLDRMLAFSGGAALAEADLPPPVLIAMFVVLVILGDFCISSMLSKFALLAPVFIPMFMMVGISPELTMAAYRIGDSVVNIVTPLNSYMLIILVVLQRYRKEAGLGSLISLMVPYSVIFAIVWTAFLLIWNWAGIPLGPGGPLTWLPS